MSIFLIKENPTKSFFSMVYVVLC